MELGELKDAQLSRDAAFRTTARPENRHLIGLASCRIMQLQNVNHFSGLQVSS